VSCRSCTLSYKFGISQIFHHQIFPQGNCTKGTWFCRLCRSCTVLSYTCKSDIRTYRVGNSATCCLHSNRQDTYSQLHLGSLNTLCKWFKCCRLHIWPRICHSSRSSSRSNLMDSCKKERQVCFLGRWHIRLISSGRWGTGCCTLSSTPSRHRICQQDMSKQEHRIYHLCMMCRNSYLLHKPYIDWSMIGIIHFIHHRSCQADMCKLANWFCLPDRLDICFSYQHRLNRRNCKISNFLIWNRRKNHLRTSMLVR